MDRLKWALLFVCGALLCGLVSLYSSIRAASRVRRLSTVTVVSLERAPLGEEVLIEGLVSNRNPVRSSPPGLVAYVREWREVTYDEEGRSDPGSWSVIERVTPPLVVELSDGVVQIINADYDIEEGLVVEERELGQSDEEYQSRYQGIRRGDRVIAVGVVSASTERPQIEASFVARGTRASYIARRRRGGVAFCALSTVVAALGGTVLLWDPVGRLFSRRRQPFQRRWKEARNSEEGKNG